MFTSWIGRKARRRTNGTATRSRRRKWGGVLRLEFLEDRWVPNAAAVTDPLAGSMAYALNTPGTSQPQSPLAASPLAAGSNLALAAPGKTITLSPTTLPGGTVGVAYPSQTITATGGSGQIHFDITGSFPSGLVVATTKNTLTISGTPTASGTFNFTINATDQSSNTGSQAYTVIVSPAPAIALSPSTVPDGTVGAAYPSTTITATGGVGDKTLEITSGALPAGLTATQGTNTLTLSGTPTASGPFSFTVTATDANSVQGAQVYTMTVSPAQTAIISPTVSPTTIAAGNDVSVSAIVGAVGNGTATEGEVVFTLTGPGGMVISNSATPATVGLDGSAGATLAIPATAPGGSYSLTVQYTDPAGNFLGSSTTVQSALTVTNVGVAISGSITPDSLTASAADQPVAASATVFNNTAPVDGGSVTFTLLNSGGTQVGAAKTGTTDASGATSVDLLVPGGTVPGTYTVEASYTDAGGAHTATVGTLTVNPIAVNLSLAPIAPISTSANDQDVNLVATVTGGGNPLNTGDVTFSVTLNGQPVTVTGTATGSDGQFTGTLKVPGGTLPGDYTVTAAYAANGLYGGAEASGALTVNPIAVNMSLAPISPITASANDQNVAVTATVMPAIGQGVVDTGDVVFTLMQGNTVIGTPVTQAVDPATGQASALLKVPGGTAAGDYTVTATYAANGFFGGAQASGTLTINPTEALIISPASLPAGYVGVAYNQAITATGGFGDKMLTTDLAPDALPAGLSYAISGGTMTISGTPTAEGSVAFQVTATDADGTAVTKDYTLSVTAAVPVVNIVAPSDAQQGNPVTVKGTFTDPAGAAAEPYNYIWTATDPNGVVVGTTGGQVNYSSGGATSVDDFTFTPPRNGTYTITLQVIDANGAHTTATQSLAVGNIAPAVTVVPPSSAQQGSPVTVTGSFTDPGGGMDQPYNYVWTATNASGSVVLTSSGSVDYASGGPTAVPDFTFTPSASGALTVSLVVTDKNGASGSASQTFQVSEAPPPPPPPPATFPPHVFLQTALDVQAMPDWSSPEQVASLESTFWTAYAMAARQSQQQALDLFWNEVGLVLDLRMAGGNPAALLNNQHAIGLANAIHDNPLYHTLAGWVMANAEMERLLVG